MMLPPSLSGYLFPLPDSVPGPAAAFVSIFFFLPPRLSYTSSFYLFTSQLSIGTHTYPPIIMNNTYLTWFFFFLVGIPTWKCV